MYVCLLCNSEATKTDLCGMISVKTM